MKNTEQIRIAALCESLKTMHGVSAIEKVAMLRRWLISELGYSALMV